LFREKWRLLNIAGGNHKQHRFFQNMFLIRAFDGAVLSTRIKVAPRGVMLAERLFYWLGSESGQEFLASTEIVRLTDKE
jgi:hypothetical protein